MVSWSWEPGYHTAEKWSNDGATESEVTSVLDKLSIFHLPVGIRRPEELTDNNNISSSKQKLDQNPEDDLKAQQSLNISPYRIEWCGRGLEAVRDICNTAPVLLKGKNTGPAKRPGQLALRAATMLVFCYYSFLFFSRHVVVALNAGLKSSLSFSRNRVSLVT